MDLHEIFNRFRPLYALNLIAKIFDQGVSSDKYLIKYPLSSNPKSDDKSTQYIWVGICTLIRIFLARTILIMTDCQLWPQQITWYPFQKCIMYKLYLRASLVTFRLLQTKCHLCRVCFSFISNIHIVSDSIRMAM